MDKCCITDGRGGLKIYTMDGMREEVRGTING
jgi:hypothetical protein